MDWDSDLRLGVGFGLDFDSTSRSCWAFCSGTIYCFGCSLKKVHMRSVAGTLLLLIAVPGHM
jgi:hypothetical protein